MTIIAAARGPDGTWIGSDGLCSADNRIASRTFAKWSIAANRKWAFAGAGSTVPASIMNRAMLTENVWTDPDFETDNNTESALRIGDWMRQSLVEAKEFPTDHASWKDYAFAPIIATPGKVWRFDSDLRTLRGELQGCYQVGGCGDNLAAGAIAALIFQNRRRQDAEREPNAIPVYDRLPAEELVRAGIEAACHHSLHCGGEIFVERLG